MPPPQRHFGLPAILAALFLLAAAVPVSTTPEQRPAPDAVRLLEAARAAIGPAVVTAFILKARRIGQTEVSSSPVEIYALWPQHYLRLTRMMSSVSTVGFSGTRVLYDFVAPSPENPGGATEAERVRLEQQVFASLALLLFARTDTILALTPSSTVGVISEGLQVNFRDSGGHVIRLTFDHSTRLPVRVDRQVALRNMSGSPAGRDVSVALIASGRRGLRGVSVPGRLTTVQDGTTIGEINVDDLEVNPALTPGDFTRYVPPNAGRPPS